jgi:hypothetical protein
MVKVGYSGEIPLIVPPFFVYRKRQLELWKDVGIEFHVETYLRNYIYCL